MSTETHTETQVPAEHGGGGNFPPFDPTFYGSQLLWLAITFGALYYILSKVALPRLAGILEERRDRIASDLDEAERLKRETDQAIEDYETALADARAKAQKIASETRDSLNAELADKRHAAEAALADKVAAAEQKIAGIRATAMGEIEGIARDAAAAIVEQVASAGADAGAVEKAVASAWAARRS